MLWLLIAAIAEGIGYVPDPSPCLAYIEGYKAAYNDYEKHCAPLHVLAFRIFERVSKWLGDNHEVIVAAATVIIAVFTVTLWRSTDKMWLAGEKQRESNERIASAQMQHARRQALTQAAETRSSLEIARKSADAAMLSAQAAIGLELPFLRIEPDKVGFGDSQEGDGARRHYWGVYTLKMSNIGRTRAVPIEIQCGWTFGDALPDEPIYKWSTGFKVDAVIEPLPAEPVEFWMHELTMDVPADASTQLRERKANLWFYVCFVYLDFMKTRHEDCFCWRRVEGFGMGQFVTDDTPAYNRRS